MEYLMRHYDRLLLATLEHIQLVTVTLLISVVVAAIITLLCTWSRSCSNIVISVLSVIYSVPSLAFMALMIPLTGLEKTTAIVVLTVYNQYLLLQNILAGLDSVDKAVIEAATGIGMTRLQLLLRIKLPLAKGAIMAGIRIALVSTVAIATIAASINAGGLGSILFEGLRTMNYSKILWGSIMSAVLTVGLDKLLAYVEKKACKI